MKKIFITILVSLLGAALFMVFCRRSFSHEAYIELTNKTDTTIKEIVIEHDNGKIIHKGLKSNEKILYPVYVYGEGSYSIHVVFSGKRLKPLLKVGYLEAGYDLHEKIYENNISESNRIF